MITGEGVGEDPAWPPEASLLILGMRPGQAVKVGRQFGQLAVLVGRTGGPAHLRRARSWRHCSSARRVGAAKFHWRSRGDTRLRYAIE